MGERTIRKRLKEAGLRGRVAAKRPLLSVVNCAKRLRFVHERNNRKKALFYDESSFQLFVVIRNCLLDVKLVNGVRKNVVCLQLSTARVPRGFGVHVGIWHQSTPSVYWGCKAGAAHPNLATIIYGPFWTRNQFIFVHDNVPCHKVKKVTDFLCRKRIQMLDWLAQSPNRNPIKILWESYSRKPREVT